MSQKYFEIEPCLDDTESYVDDWEFTHWPNKPTGDIIENSDGTFSVVMEENFVPLIEQLQGLFKEGKMPEGGTYLGEAVLRGRKAPNDLVWDAGFINGSGILVSSRLLSIIKQFEIPEYCHYEIPLIQGKKRHDSYHYINFDKEKTQEDHDIRFEGLSEILVSERLKKAIEYAGLIGCEFTRVD